MEQELEKLKKQLNDLINDYVLPFDVSHHAAQLIDEIEFWQESGEDS